MERRSFLTLLVGAPLLAKLEPPRVFPAAPIVPAPAPALAVGTVFPGHQRISMASLPFAPADGSTIVEAGRIALFVAQPQAVFRPDRLLLTTDVIDGAGMGFDLLGVSASGVPMFDQVVPADYFDPRAFGLGGYHWGAAAPGVQYVMAVRNCGPTRPFHACFVGRMVDDRPLTAEELERERQLAAADDFQDIDGLFDDDPDDDPDELAGEDE